MDIAYRAPSAPSAGVVSKPNGSDVKQLPVVVSQPVAVAKAVGPVKAPVVPAQLPGTGMRQNPAQTVSAANVQKSVPIPDSDLAQAAQLAKVSGYTIQIATFKGQDNAQQEITALKKQGLIPVLRPSGKYKVLCVGNFPNQETAKSLLTQLKRKYRDCYIRRL